jgi:hypothetical protein
MKPFFTDAGDEWDYDRRFDPDVSWRSRQKVEVAGNRRDKFVQIFINTGAQYDKRAEEILWRGVCALALCDKLEAAGVRVEIWAITAATDSHLNTDVKHTAVKVKLKDYDEPLDIGRIACAAGLVGFHRTVMFWARALVGSQPRSGFGTSVYDIQGGSVFCSLVRTGLHLSSGLIIEQIWTKEQASTWLRSALLKLSEGVKETDGQED